MVATTRIIGNSYAAKARRIIAAAQVAKPFPVMASPPTVAVGAAGANSTIATSATTTAPTILASDARVRQVGGRWIAAGAGSYMRPDSVSTGGTSAGSPGSGFEIMIDAPDIDFSSRVNFNIPSYRIYVDEGSGFQLVTSSGTPATTNGDFPSPGGTTGSWYYIKVSFGSSKLRRVRILFNTGAGTSANIFGFNIASPVYTLYPSSRRAPLIVGLGDSFTNGTGGDYLNGSWIHRLGELLGCETVASGGSGTGYVKISSGNINKTFADRSLTDVHTYNPDLAIVWGGVNDYDQVVATLQANAAATLTNIRSLLPSTPIIMVGSNNAPGQVVDASHLAAIKAGFTAAADAGMAFLNDNSPYLTLGGRVGATTGTGNSDLYTGTDNLHPPQAGHGYYASRIAEDAVAWLQTLSA